MNRYPSFTATRPLFELAEGVLWDDRAGLVRWVDIEAGTVHHGRLANGQIVDIVSDWVDSTVGAVAVAEDGGLLVAGARGLIAVSANGIVSVGPDVLGRRANARLNDGAVDPHGRFVVGSVSLGQTRAQEQLLRISPDGRVEVLRDDVHLSNGIGFSPDGRTIYHVDTLAPSISTHSYGPGAFDLAEPWVELGVELPFLADGLAVSSDGSLWVAQWGGFAVHRIAPTGELLDVVVVDAEFVTSAAFVGPDLDALAISTARISAGEPKGAAGSLFLASVEAKGMPTPRWAGNTSIPYWSTAEEHSE